MLQQDLFHAAPLISQYTLDKQKAPQALDDLVPAGYIKQIPNDPMTGSNSNWTVDQEDYASCRSTSRNPASSTCTARRT